MLTRRQFLSYTAALGAASAFSWQTYKYLNRKPPVSINRVGLPLGHLLRDGELLQAPTRRYECNTLILGGGAAGLGALWYLAKHHHRDVLLAEGFERNGNNAAYTSSDGLKSPSGAHYLALPSKESVYVREMLADFGILQPDGSFRETDLVYAPESRLLYQDKWVEHLLPKEDADSKRFFDLIGRLKQAYGDDGKKIFAIPIALSSADETWRKLDSLTFKQWLEQEGYNSSELLWYLDYCCRDDYGQGIGQVSAFAGLHYFAARNSAETVLTWPEGLAYLSENLRRHAGLQEGWQWPSENRICLEKPASVNASAVKIKPLSDGRIEVWLRDNAKGETVAITAQHLISAMPLMVAARIIESPEQFGLDIPEYAPWLVSNFELHSFPKEKNNSELAWDNVVYGSQGLGYVVATNQLIRVARPERTIFTAYAALNHDTPQAVRRQLLEASDEELLQLAAQDLLTAYGEGFWRHVSRVDITVRGHGMSVPKPGYLSDEALLKIRSRNSGLLFAHSDLSSYSVFEEALYWGVEAARKVLGQG